MQTENETFLGGDRVKTRLFDSKTILEAKYDSVLEVLTIEFMGGGKYDYFGVDQELANGLFDAPSAGKYFAEHIRPYKKANKL
jgi:hypothetical protein